MKLIDGKVLLQKVRECKAKQHSENNDYRTGYISAMSTVEGIIADLASVDAIPVEWLEKYMREPILKTGIHNILYLWQKEQEAKA